MEKKQIILPEKRYEKASTQDLTTTIGLENSSELLREGDKTVILNLDELYFDERNDSKNYKIYGKLKMVFRNMYLGLAPYDNLNEYLYLQGDGADNNFYGYMPYNEFAFLRNDIYRNDPNIFTVNSSSLGTYTPSFVLPDPIPNKHQTLSLLEAPYHNWNIYLTYVNDQDSAYPMKYTLSGATKTENVNLITFVSGDGIPCRVESKTGYYKLTCPVKHGINDGEFVKIKGITSKVYSVSSLGDERYDSQYYVINLNKAQFSGTSLAPLIIIKRCVDAENISGTTSSYYVHKHRVLTDSTHYILDKAGFETPIFEDEKKLLLENAGGLSNFLVERNRMESVIFDFKDSFILTGLTNNLDFTPTEVYLSVINRNGSGYFDQVKVGYRFHLHDTWIDNHFSGTTSVEPSIQLDTAFTKDGVTFHPFKGLNIGDTLIGAFVEYNHSELKERVISEAFHKLSNPVTIFNYRQEDPTYYSGATNANKVGLYYQPHHKIKLRELSPYVETSNTNNILDLPENAEYFPSEGLWKWRDLYDHGYIDPDGNGTDYPFVNGQHYVMSNINFYLRNEQAFTNKSDGINAFDKTNTNC